MKDHKFNRVVSLVLSCTMIAGMLPASVLAAVPDGYNYKATEYLSQVAGVDALMGEDDDLNIYVSIDMAADDDHIYSYHTCSNPQVDSPEIVKATNDSAGSVTYECDNCGAFAQVEIPMLDADQFVEDEDGLKANGSEWERWFGTGTFLSEEVNGNYIVQSQPGL